MPTLTTRHLWLGLPIFIAVLKGFIFPLPLLDFWWHLKMGHVILETGSIPRTDIFSFTAAGKPFIVQNWLAEVVLSLVYKAGGLPLLVFFNTLLLIAILLPVYYLCRKATSLQWPAIFSASLVSICMLGNLRPQVFSFLLFSLFYLLLDDFRRQRRDRLWLLPILMVVWVNVHGGFVLGIILCACYLVSGLTQIFSHNRFKSGMSGIQISRLAVCLPVCLLSTLLNPETFRIYQYLVTVLRDPSSQQYVYEWQSPHIGTVQGVFLFFLPFSIVTVALIIRRRKIELADISIYLVFSFLGLSAIRYSVYFLILAAPMISRYLPAKDRADADIPSENAASRQSFWLKKGRNPAFFNFAIAAAALIIVVMQSPWVQSRYFHNSLLEPKTPVGVMDFIEQHSLQGNIAHPQIYGDYFIWRLWPKQRSFFDGRVHLFGKSFFLDYQNIFNGSNWEALCVKYGIRYILINKDDATGAQNDLINSARSSPTWSPIYEDSICIFFKKRRAE